MHPAAPYAVSIFTSAALLFCVQPMVGRLLLPTLGGSPQVWTTCLLFFQAALLTGYGLAHLLSTRLGLRGQLVTHIAALLVAAAVLPIALPEASTDIPQHGLGPALWALWALAVAVGPPFVALSMNSPLLQRWFSLSGAPGADDPYFLYAASNAGSFLGLLGYPVLVEPWLGAASQTRWWAVAYGAMLVLVALTAAATWRSASAARQVTSEQRPSRDAPPSRLGQLKWVALAAVPSSLLMGATTFLTTDLAAIPLLWVIPLAIYLLTWIATFAPRPWIGVPLLARALPILVVAWLLLDLTEATEPAWALVLFHLLTFAAAALLCHGRLAEDRPAPVHLTRFFLLTSLGGVLGGCFNALVAPALFVDLWEYPIAVIAACAALPMQGRPRFSDALWPLLVGGVALAGALLGPKLGLSAGPAATLVIFGVPVLGAWLLSDRPVRFTIAAALVLLVAPLAPSPTGAVVRCERSFFGVQRVTTDATGRFDQVVHGHTLHGRQWRHGPTCEPLAYYHPEGPLGDIALARVGRFDNVAMVGVGAGSMLYYRPESARWWVVDIDPATWVLARQHFTFLRACPPNPDARQQTEEVLADGRIAFEGLPKARKFGAIVIDVFSSDAIPVHMLTCEAFDVYLAHLEEDGLLAFHASNRYLDVVSVLAAVGHDRGLSVLVRDDKRSHRAAGSEPSRWVAMTRAPTHFGLLQGAKGWCAPRRHDRVWTDDFNDLPRLFAQSLSQSDSCSPGAQPVP